MKKLKEIILMFAVVSTLTLGVSAQEQNDDQKRPIKKPPVREPKEKPPKGNDRPPKKPGMSFYLVSSGAENILG